MRMIVRLGAALMAGLCLLPEAGGAQSPVRIGVSLPLSGAVGEPSRDMLRAVELFVAERNRAGGVGGRALELVVADDENTAEGARRVATRFARDSTIVAVVGHYYSSAAIGAGSVYEREGLVNIVPLANDPRVTADRDWVFGMLPSTSVEGGFMAAYLREVVEADRVAVLAETGTYGAGLEEAFLEKARRLEMEVVTSAEFDPADPLPSDFARRALQGHRGGLDAVLLYSQAAVGRKLIAQVRQAGLRAPIFAPSAFVEDPGLPRFYAPYRGELLAVSPFLFQLGNQRATRFHEDYTAMSGEEPGTDAPMAYDAVRLVAQAVAEAGPDRRAIRDWLSDLGRARPLEAVTGSLRFDESGAMDRALYVTRVEDERFQIAFDQLLVASEPHVLQDLDRHRSRDEIVLVDDIPYHRTSVVYVGVDAFRVTRVETALMTFDMELFLWFRWTDEEIDTDQLHPVNAVSTGDEERYVVKEELSGDVRYRVYRIKSSFVAPFDVRRFPYDLQALPLTVLHRTRSSKSLFLVPDIARLPSGAMEIYDPEWSFVEEEIFSELYRYRSSLGDPNVQLEGGGQAPVYFSTVNLEILVEREILPHVFTLFIPLFLVLGLTTGILWLPRADYSLRITIGMTAIMALLVFNLAVAEELPNVGYLTVADVYFVIGYVVLAALTVKVVIAYLLDRIEKQAWAARMDVVGSLVILIGTLAAYATTTWTM